MSDPIPGVPGSEGLVLFQHASARRWILFAMLGVAVAADGAGYIGMDQGAGAEGDCHTNTYYDSYDECVAALASGSEDFTHIAAGLGALFAVLGSIFVVLRERTPAFVKTLAEAPESISTIYLEEFRMRGAPKDVDGDLWVEITLRRGGKQRLATPDRKSAGQVLAAVAKLAPQARREAPRAPAT